jgi:hypothetical protein
MVGKFVTAGEIYKRFNNTDGALEEIEREAERRVREFAAWLLDKRYPKKVIESYCNNIFESQCVITQHEPPYMFLEEARDDITKRAVSRGKSYGFLFKYHVLLDAIKETFVDEDYIKALKLYFQFLLKKKYISKIPRVVKEILGEEEIYLRRLKEYHESRSEDDEEFRNWFTKWCREIFEL